MIRICARGAIAMNWVKKFMNGRYGADQLSIALLFLWVVISLISRLTGSSVLIALSYIPIVFAAYRMFSKDIKKRSMENYKFAIFMSPVYVKYKKMKSRIRGFKTHKYFKCEKCNTKLRVPRNKGKIMVTCPKCKITFVRKT